MKRLVHLRAQVDDVIGRYQRLVELQEPPRMRVIDLENAIAGVDRVLNCLLMQLQLREEDVLAGRRPEAA